MNNYDDIMKLERPISKRATMSINQRAAQFAPFSALTGYSEKIEDVSKVTVSKLELTEDKKAEIDFKIRHIQKNIKLKPEVSITYFVSTKGYNLGFYKTFLGTVKKIDKVKKQLTLEDDSFISFADILDIC